MMKRRDFTILGLLVCLVGYAACNRISEGSAEAAQKIKKTTTATFESTIVPEKVNDDSADDPAIWINPVDHSKSKIIGTDKKGGLIVYNLKGEQLFYYPYGRMNNVDVRSGFILNGDTIDLVAASNRSNKTIVVYQIKPDGSLTDVVGKAIQSQMTEDVYGFCLYKSPVSNKIYAFVNSKLGEVEQWELIAENHKVSGKLVRKFKLEGKVEGMVADDSQKRIFVGEEDKGIWVFDAEPTGQTKGFMLPQSAVKTNANIHDDIEGLALYKTPENKGYLLASSQGNYSYAVFDRNPPYKYIGSFRVTDGVVDGIEETDGIEIYSQPLDSTFKHGLFIAQDGYNRDKGELKAQNFKLVKWENIAKLFSPNLEMN